VLGDADNAVIPEDGDVMLYGDGGAGKTTLAIDLACHLAAGESWLGIKIPQPRRVLLIENEGPRSRFRRKLRRKLDAWSGSALSGRVSVLENPWAQFTLAEESWREFLASHVRDHEVDVVVVGPLVSAGMETAGTLQDVRAFLELVADVRRRAGLRLVVVLIHHENKGGKVSGAWEGAGDTLVHVQAQGHGRLRLHWQKTRWASDFHATTLQLLWADGDGFQIEERDELDDETLAGQILAFIGDNPGTAWSKVEKATPGVNRQRRMTIRDGLFAASWIVNVRRKKGEPERALDHVEEATPAHLFLADDPAISHLLPEPGAVGEHSAPARGEGGPLHPLPAPHPLREQGVGEQSAPPADEGLVSPLIGDEMFPPLLANAVKSGHIDQDEAKERYALYELVERSRRGEGDE
jgi:putative DNA primase/helicase